MDERRKRLLGPDADDADVRGEHRYPEDDEAGREDVSHQSGPPATADEALTRQPGQYTAGAEGTQPVETRAPKR